MQSYLHRHKKKVVILLLIGLTLSLFLKSTLNIGWKRYVSDAFFSMSIIFFIYGLWEFVLNVGFFNGFIYGSKHLKRLIFPRLAEDDNVMSENGDVKTEDDYPTFVKKRKKDREVAAPLLIATILFIISILISFIF